MHKVKQGQRVLFEGTAKECWTFLVEKFADSSVRMLINFGIHID